MAEYLVASGSRKISVLPSVSELSGSTSMPIVMGGSTVQISYTNFLTNNLLAQSNTFTQPQAVVSGTAVTELTAGIVNIYATTGNQDTFEVVVQDGNGIRFFDWDGASMQSFLEVDTLSGPITILRDTTITGDLTASLSFSNLINTPTLVSGSSQVIALLPSGTVSGSSQVSFTNISNKPTLISSSQQISDLGFITSLQIINTASFATTGSNAFVGNQTISGSITASLQEGYVLVGNSFGITQAVPTSSFGGGSGFPFTGSAEITGSLEVTGSLGTTETISTQILLTPQILTGHLIVPSGFNGMLTGPVSNGGELTIEAGSNLVIL